MVITKAMYLYLFRLNYFFMHLWFCWDKSVIFSLYYSVRSDYATRSQRPLLLGFAINYHITP